MEKSESKGAFPCIIVYSSERHVKYINTVLNDIESVLKGKGFEPILLGDEVRSGDDYFRRLEELIDKSVLGVIILDGFRPNVLFEFGYLKGKGKPTIILKDSEAFINVKTLYDNNKDHGLTDIQFDKLRNPKIALSRHLSDFVRHIAIFEWYVDENDQNHVSKVLEEELKKFDSDIRNEAERILTKGVPSDSRFVRLIQNLISSIFNAESFNLDMVKNIHKEIEEFAKTNHIHLPYHILKTIADSYVEVAKRSHQLDANSKIEAYESALNIYDDIITKFKDDKEIYALAKSKIGYLKMELIKYKGFDKVRLVNEAIRAYEEALNIITNDAVIWNNQGVSLAKLQKYNEAIECFDKAIAINPNYAGAWYNKGNALAKLQKYNEAIDAYNKAIEINPNLAEAWYNKGLALAKLQKYEEAIDAYNKARLIFESINQHEYAKLAENTIKILASKLLNKDCRNMSIDEILKEIKKVV